MIENIVQIPNINGKLLPPIITSTGLKQSYKLVKQSYKLVSVGCGHDI